MFWSCNKSKRFETTNKFSIWFLSSLHIFKFTFWNSICKKILFKTIYKDISSPEFEKYLHFDGIRTIRPKSTFQVEGVRAARCAPVLCTDFRSEHDDDGDEEVVEAARWQRRRRRPRPHGHPRYGPSSAHLVSPHPFAWGPAISGSLKLFVARRRDLHAEQEELVRSLEQKQAHESRRWRVRAAANSRPIRLRVWRSCYGRWFNSIRFWCSRSMVISCLCSACLRGSSLVMRPFSCTPASTMPGLPGSWLVACSFLFYFLTLCFASHIDRLRCSMLAFEWCMTWIGLW